MAPSSSSSCSCSSPKGIIAILFGVLVLVDVSSVVYYFSVHAGKEQASATTLSVRARADPSSVVERAPLDQSPAAQRLRSLRDRAQRAAKSPLPPLVTVFSAECSAYHDWQTVTLYDSWKRAHIPGLIVRTLACSQEQLRTYDRVDGLGEQLLTHVHDRKEGAAGPKVESYPPLNKPWGLMSWLKEGEGRKLSSNTVFLIVDPDFSFRPYGVLAQITPILAAVGSGLAAAVGQDYTYVAKGFKAMQWALPRKFNASTDVEQLQSIGPPIFIRKDKLSELVRGWYDITLSIVQHPEVHALVHDGNQLAPWIAEMCGYSIAASGWLIHQTQVEWPELETPQPPYASMGGDFASSSPILLHYSHPFVICGRKFGKQLLRNLDVLNCSETFPDSDQFVPPSKGELDDKSCKCCMEAGDVLGLQSDGCFNGPNEHFIKRISWEAWARVSTGIINWRSLHCVSGDRKSVV